MEKYKYESKSEKSLISNACAEFDVKENEIFTNIYEEKGGLLKGKKYILEFVKIEDLAQFGKEILLELLKCFNLDAKIEIKIRDKQIRYEIHTNNNSIIIGKRGHILDSLQTYVKQSLYTQTDIYPIITIDVENYKQRQNFFLEKNVKQVAKEVLKTKSEVKLDPMNSYERKIVHDSLSNFKNIVSESVGEEPNRYIVIKYMENN